MHKTRNKEALYVIMRFTLQSALNRRKNTIYMKEVAEAMPKSRLEAFSDGVIAIIITIMVLGIKVPLHLKKPVMASSSKLRECSTIFEML